MRNRGCGADGGSGWARLRAMTEHRVGFLRWRSDLPSGGNRYDDELAARLPGLGIGLRAYPIAGPWPCPTPADRRCLAATLDAEQHWLIGNIVASGAPDILAAATAQGRRVTLLLHYFPADDPGLPETDRRRLGASEAAAVRFADTVVVTSAWAARAVAERYGRHDVVVAAPGVDSAEPSDGSLGRGRPPSLLWLGSLTPTKDPLTFVDALVLLRDRAWDACLVGPDTVDPDLSRRVRDRIRAGGLSHRVRVLGPHEADALAPLWDAADLLVHTSRAETYGMVVSEALARAVPAIVASGTGAREAQRVGDHFPPGDAAALAGVLRRWLTEPRLRERWRDAAAEHRAHLPTWAQPAGIIAGALIREPGIPTLTPVPVPN